ncbi:hypothetical protein [Novosphingobium olei]|uniref:hypothetical protein n=1 Tax=Novosphingobium olei TaxID=2728851 RepID=UPI0030904F82|nr:hypothetical protein NSDW_11490 [Novosphingobium olei]
MATPKVFVVMDGTWKSVEGAAASVAGVTWQCLGPEALQIAFTTAAPANNAVDAYHNLARNEAYYDKSGSAKVWARGPVGTALSATAD